MSCDADAGQCPFFQSNDCRCAGRFTLEHVSEVFELCLGEFKQCAVYHDLKAERQTGALPVLARAG